MAEVLFRYLAATRGRRGWRQRLLGREPAPDDAIERLVRSVAIRIRTTVRRERVTSADVSVPASIARRTRFFNEEPPTPPDLSAPRAVQERRPIESSLNVAGCAVCHATGRITCPRCHGRQRLLCGRCGGMGGHHDGGNDPGCRECGGRGATPCEACVDGQVTHDPCGGEGYLARWREAVYDWWFETYEEECTPDPTLSRAIGLWIAGGQGVAVAQLDRAGVRGVLGYDTPEVGEVIASAAQARDRLDRWGLANRTSGTALRHEITVVPVSACVVKRAGAAEWHWLVGQGDQALMVAPAGLDRRKAVLWSAAGLAALVAPMLTSAGLVVPPIVVVLALLRLRRGPTQLNIVLARRPGVPSCVGLLTALGAFVKAFEVVDRDYRRHLDALLVPTPPPGEVSHAIVRLPSGLRLRLVEIEEAAFTPGEFAQLATGTDGLVILRDADGAGPAGAEQLLPAASLVLDATAAACDSAGHASGGAVAVELLRRGFLRELPVQVDWRQAFESLWSPVRQVIEEGRPAPTTPQGLPTSGSNALATI